METKRELSVGTLVIVKRSEPNVLLLIQNNDFYKRHKGFEKVIDIGPKGHVERGESDLSTAQREAREEIGLKLNIDTGFSADETYEFDGKGPNGKYHVIKTVRYFISLISEEDLSRIKLSQEHRKSELLPISRVIATQMVKPGKIEVLKKALNYLGSSQMHDR